MAKMNRVMSDYQRHEQRCNGDNIQDLCLHCEDC